MFTSLSLHAGAGRGSATANFWIVNLIMLDRPVYFDWSECGKPIHRVC